MRHAVQDHLLKRRPFLQIPGPNPIVVRGAKGEWDDGVSIEASDVLKDHDTYYLYYHGGERVGQRFRIGVATATHPLGPFKKPANMPLLDLGRRGGWEDLHVACATILKEGADRYYMWYSGIGKSKKHFKWCIGLATASSPLGPWKKFEGNPVLSNFGYVSGVVKVKGKYYLYAEHPIGARGPDYGPMALAIADRPEGPWTPWTGNPVLGAGEWGEWDDGGISEAKVVQANGMFHMFYGGAKLHPQRVLTRESIGYAYSRDGFHFTKYAGNPVATREANPNAAALAEVDALIEPPFIYLYHTLRYEKPHVAADEKEFPKMEYLGVQVLAMGSPFRLAMPLLSLPALKPRATTILDDCPPLSLNGTSLAVTVECAYRKKAKTGMRIHARSSCDGMQYDTRDLFCLECDCEPGRTARQTFELDVKARFLKFLVENPDALESVSDVKITATLSG
jgi:hypothetical protein